MSENKEVTGQLPPGWAVVGRGSLWPTRVGWLAVTGPLGGAPVGSGAVSPRGKPQGTGRYCTPPKRCCRGAQGMGSGWPQGQSQGRWGHFGYSLLCNRAPQSLTGSKPQLLIISQGSEGGVGSVTKLGRHAFL